MKAYSVDVRERIVRAYEQRRGSQRALASLFAVSLSFVEKLLHRHRTTGEITPQNRADQSPGTRLKPSTYPKRRTDAVKLPVAGGMDQPQIGGVVRTPGASLLGDTLASTAFSSMKIMHDFYHNNSLNFLILRIILYTKRLVDNTAEQMAAHRKEDTMYTNGHTTVWGIPIGIGRARATKSWYQQLRDWWTAHKAARQQANLDALHRCWDATREAVTSQRAEAAPEMAAAHHGIAVATMFYGLNS